MGWPTDEDIERDRVNQAELDIAASEHAWQERRIAELEAALKPFASCLVYEKHGEQWFCRLELARVTQADFARAANLLGKTTE